ncbi:FecR family protein [Mangrovibacterium lignilyticum]|uniref:FecR family protein n=1 Tax=Mangrovibacterium lignilyticum TaxID=2668052 RepID=UPI0013D0443E|nr:FecR domain-containing protein [Mangrovibacterium lignilyticum]
MAPKYTIDIKIIWKSIHGQLTVEEQKLLQNWLNEDSSHRSYYLQAKRYYQKGTSFSNSKAEMDRAWQSFANRERLMRRRLIFRKLAVAASILILVAATTSILYWQFNNQPALVAPGQLSLIEPGSGKATLFFDDGRTYELTNSGKLQLQEDGVAISNTKNGLAYVAGENALAGTRYNILRVPRGGEYALTLPDGTHVWMNSESSIRYPIKFGENERRVEIQGQAFFEVAHNEEKPFLVWSGNQQIQVLGTQFDLKAYQNDETITTTLVRGSVRIRLKNDPEVQETLAPNEQCTFNKTDNSLNKRVVETLPFVSWRNGRLVFENEELGEIMKTLGRWYDFDVVFASEKTKHIRFTGTLKRYDKIDKVLNKIAKTNEIRINVNENRISIE